MSRLSQRQTRAKRPLRRKTRLSVEQLEARNLLAAFVPSQLVHAYGFDLVTFAGGIKGDGTGQTIAIVDAFDNPNIVADLDKFSQTYGLPDSSSGLVFQKLTPQGTPAFNSGWALEIALDVEWAHAIAPKAKIILVESLDNSGTNLYAADVFAANQAGVSVVSNSWGGSEYSSETSDDANFSHTGVTFVFSSGDSGSPAQYPSASPNVLSVGGTTLTLDSNGNWLSETGWGHGRQSRFLGGSGGGPSRYEAKPSYQSSIVSGTKRGTPDVAYDADPNTGVSVYDSNNGGFLQVGGTSAGAPQWAALIAIVNQGRALNGQSSLSGSALLSAIYTAPSSNFHDITSGNNGYRAIAGYDFVTGRGSPIANLLIPTLVSATASSNTIQASASTGTVKSTRLLGTRLTLPTTTFDPSLVNTAFFSRSSTPQVQTVHPLTIVTTAPTFAGANPTQAPTMRFNAMLSGGSDRLADDLDSAEPLLVMPAPYPGDKPAPISPAGPVDDSSAVSPMSRKAVDDFFMAPVLAADPTEIPGGALAVQEEGGAPVAELNVGMIGFVSLVGGSWAVRVARVEEKRPALRS